MNELPASKVAQIRNLFSFGRTIRQTAKYAGVSHVTVLRYFRQFRAEGIHRSRCECGQFGGHRGWCWWRFKQSKKRQEYMASIGHYSGKIKSGIYDQQFVPWIKQKEKCQWQKAKRTLKEVQEWLKENAPPCR